MAFPIYASANQMSMASPASVVISGNDAYGKAAYSITISYKSADNEISAINVSVYDQSIEISKELLSQVNDINLNKISAANDAGVFGSYFYIYLPYGPVGKCSTAKEHGETHELYISSLGTMNKKGLSAKIIDPCAKS